MERKHGYGDIDQARGSVIVAGRRPEAGSRPPTNTQNGTTFSPATAWKMRLPPASLFPA